MLQFYFLPTLCFLSITNAAELSYDYIIIGGGTSGLVIANRLTELHNVTVAVIEAGGEVITNTNVTEIDKFTAAIGTDIDWNYVSTNQTYADSQVLGYSAGKALGGTSTINGTFSSRLYIRTDECRNDICTSPEVPD